MLYFTDVTPAPQTITRAQPSRYICNDAPVTLLRRAKILNFYFSFCNKKKKKGRREGGRKEGKNYLKGGEYIFQFTSCFQSLLLVLRAPFTLQLRVTDGIFINLILILK